MNKSYIKKYKSFRGPTYFEIFLSLLTYNKKNIHIKFKSLRQYTIDSIAVDSTSIYASIETSPNDELPVSFQNSEKITSFYFCNSQRFLLFFVIFVCLFSNADNWSEEKGKISWKLINKQLQNKAKITLLFNFFNNK